MPRVSILMPVYNAAAYVREAIRGLQAQTFSDFEVVVVDDGSTDPTAAILREEARRDSRVRLLSHDRNRGLPTALNLAADVAQGEWLARQDADDISEPHRLERQVAFLTSHEEVGVVGGQMHEIDAGGQLRGTYRTPLSHGMIVWSELFGRAFAHPTVMMRRRVLSFAPLYDPVWKDAEDVDLWIRLTGRTRFANLPDVLCRYRVHAESVTRRRRSERNDAAWVRRYCFACEILGRRVPWTLWMGWRRVLVGGGRISPRDQRRLVALLRNLFEALCSRGWIPEEDRSGVEADLRTRCAELNSSSSFRTARVQDFIRRGLPCSALWIAQMLLHTRRALRMLRLRAQGSSALSKKTHRLD